MRDDTSLQAQAQLQQLANRYRRVRAPADFVSRLGARAARRQQQTLSPGWRRVAIPAAAAAVLALVFLLQPFASRLPTYTEAKPQLSLASVKLVPLKPGHYRSPSLVGFSLPAIPVAPVMPPPPTLSET